jgi:hypothetical protein
MHVINKNKSLIQLILFCLLIVNSACSKETDKITETEKTQEIEKTEEINKEAEANFEKLEAGLQENIAATYQKYLEIDYLQQKLNDDIKAQIDSISCSSNRLVLLKNNGLVSSDAIKKLIQTVDLLEIKEVKEAKESKFFSVITNRKYNYKYKINRVPILIHCVEYYKRVVPHSQLAKDLEIRVFEEEIARAIKRLNTFPQRLEIAERIASEATACQSFLQKRLNEYLVDKNPAFANAGFNKYKEFIAEAEKSMKQLNDMSEILATPADVSFVESVFN